MKIEEIRQLAEIMQTYGLERVELEPMSSYERKLVHDIVADLGHHSQSRGEGRDRRLVVTAA